MEDILEKIEIDSKKVEELRSKLLIAKKVQLHTGIDGFYSPNVYGTYRNTGGECLGISKDSYTPMNLSMFLDVIVNSITEADLDLDVEKLDYKEYKGGKKVTFDVPLQNFEIKSPMVGDIMETKLVFKTGFDSLTKSSISYFTKRLWCSNGASRWDGGYTVAFKNTKNNADKYLSFTNEIIQTKLDVSNYVEKLNDLVLKPVSQEKLDLFYLSMFGINRTTYAEAHKKSQNIFDAINAAVAIESANTGSNLFSLLQGATRYFTHNLAEEEGDLMFANPAVLNQRAHELVFSMS